MLAAAILLGAMLGVAGSGAIPTGGAALLVGGALIGVPHGSSDFVVAHAMLSSRLGRLWLPAFLVAYLALVGAVLVCWAVAPLATLVVFLILSALHFGSGDVAVENSDRPFAVAVRATTPLLPILLLHPAAVSPLIAPLVGTDAAAVIGWLAWMRWPLLILWLGAVTVYVVRRLAASGQVAAGDAREVVLLAVAGAVLPPLACFAIYFCLVHAVRHMIGIADQRHPTEPHRAARLAALVVLPSAAICGLALALSWDALAGRLDAAGVIVWALRIIAALTLPHMALEAWADHRRRIPPRQNARTRPDLRSGRNLSIT